MKSHRWRRKGKGQISILIVLSLIPMFMLFAFVVNIGMLVHAKISLQNAADLAAYAGAATQARHMTHISHVNYQMRQVYKKFIYKYLVVGNISLKCFPRPGLPAECGGIGADGQKMKWENRSAQGAGTGYPGVPVTCISLSTESNPCQLVKAVPIVQKPDCAPIDPTCSALQQAAAGIGAIQQKACQAGSTVNAEVMGKWLYATEFSSTMSSHEKLTGLVNDDVGMITEELLNFHRIQTLQDIINQPPKTKVTPAKLATLKGGPDPSKIERTVLAFKTAAGNLNPKVFELDSFEMTELLPSAQMMELKPIRLTNFGGWVAYMDGDDPKTGCNMKLEEFKANPIVGVHRIGTTLVYYAVKLTVKARLLFNPFPFGKPADSIDLTAYAAAMPFGSRIGPVLTENDFVSQLTAKAAKPGGGTDNLPAHIPDLKIKADGSLTYQSTDVLKAFFNNLKEVVNGAQAGGSIGTENIQRGIRAATLPDEFEIGKYNIPVDAEFYSGSGGDHEFHPYYRTNVDAPAEPIRTYAFWAPVVGIDGADKFSQEMQGELGQLATIAGGIGGGLMVQNKKKLQENLQASFGKLMIQLGERNNKNIARIPDPLSQVYFKIKPPIPSIPGKIIGDYKGEGPKLATSYASENDAQFFAHGRDGYSVKFIPFEMITRKPGQLSNDGGQPTWAAVRDSFDGESTELRNVRH